MFQTTSPSYLLMGSMSWCISYLKNYKKDFLTYEKKVIKLQDLQEIVRNLPTEEDKYMYIYGNFADDGYEKIFDRLVDNISAEAEPRVSTGTGTSKK